jgi:phosphoribosyl 1,2-cyclic phosphate phosphodiesterase
MPKASLEFLGTGTSQGVPVIGCHCHVCASSDARDQRLRASALLRVDGAALLIDAGPDLRQQMLRARVDALDAVLITHEHMDHIGGIDDLRAFNFKQQRPMDIHGSERSLGTIERTFHYAFGAERYPGVPELRLHPIAARRFRVAGAALQTIEVMHDRLPVLGFRAGDLAYITDAKTMADAEVERLRGIDTLVLNALRLQEHPSHLNLSEALELVERIAPRRAWFTHISHLLGRHAEVERHLPHGVRLAYDGLVIEPLG